MAWCSHSTSSSSISRMVFHLLVNNTPYPRNEKQPQGPRFVIRTFTILDSAQIGSKTGPNPRGDLRGCTSDPLEFSGLASPCLYPALKSTGPSAWLRASQVLVHTPAQGRVLTAMVLGCHSAWRAGTQRATGGTGAKSYSITSVTPARAEVRPGSLHSTAPDSGPTAADSTPPSWAAGAPAPPGRVGT